ncbi:UMP kinase [Candidatus Schneideria nysicola]|uniref:UMP kinase n=1 Tax=Candidatus Schneideria nysicola TaxID=1081631 RepID=UPI001CAA542A|nr:UMP kinase [Candidatus Schneideria nysicola]UAJ65334.1 UMP kinase [Candidatus Schneideria nysicola]
MSVNTKKPIYRRIILKLSGEALQGKKNFGIDFNILNRITHEIKELVKLDIQVSIVLGGGNLFRGTKLVKIGVNRITGDHIGILSTLINSLAMRDTLIRSNIRVCLMSAIPINGICVDYNREQALHLLKNKYVVIFSAGTGNPIFTTDSAACLRGIEMEADVILKGTKVDGVFSSDPIKFPTSDFYTHLSYQDVLEKNIKVMDSIAFLLARDHNLPIRIFNINKSGNLLRVIMGEQEGTLINNRRRSI